MENVKNNFEEMKKMLLGALEILEQTNGGLVERIQALEGRVEVLEERVKELEQHAVADNEAYAPTASLFAASAAEVNDEVAEMSETEMFEAEQIEAEQAEQIEAEQAELEEQEQEQEGQPQEQPVESEEQPLELEEQLVEPQEQAGFEEAEPAELFAETEAETETEAVGTMMINDFVADEQRKIVNEAAKPDWYDWEVDYPAAYVDDVYKGISFNDRFEFIKELFNVTGSLDEAEMAFKETLDMINSLENFKQVVAYIRERFPQWDEQSDEVYRFYMAVRRKFNK